MMFDIACVGILVADAIAKPVDKIPEKGRLELVSSLSLYTGGCAANAAIDLARIGRKAAVIGKIGDDGFGAFLSGALQKEGVDTSGVVISRDDSTSASLVIVSADGERSFIHCVGANGTFRERDIDDEVIDQSSIVFVAGCMLMPAFDGEDCALFLNKCKQKGKITALDTAWDSKGRWMNLLASCMPSIDYFLPSYEEAVELSGLKDPGEIADCFLGMGPHAVAVKLGKDGCYVKSRLTGEHYRVPTYTDITVADTTGAGDAFCAGFLAALSAGKSLLDCARFANAVGTHCVMAPGASTGIRSEEEILSFMKKY